MSTMYYINVFTDTNHWTLSYRKQENAQLGWEAFRRGGDTTIVQDDHSLWGFRNDKIIALQLRKVEVED